jgi:Ser/Thr protein kinase RdoA (MazF antagonist)
MLTALAGRLPVPPVLDRHQTRLQLGYVPGHHGQELIDRGLAEHVLRACGLMLRRIQAIDFGEVPVLAGGSRPAVVVHGDYGPQNMLFDRAASEITAVLDWEWAHAGDLVEDVSWLEWIIRMHHPGHVPALSAFFGAYGHRPPWAARHQAMITKIRSMLALSERRQPGAPDTRQWQQRLRVTESWAE